MRIISLVPSLTETIAQWVDPSWITACTSYCVRPRRLLQHATIIGGTKNPNIELIRSLAPDLVLMHKEENRLEDAEALRSFTSTWVTEVASIQDVPAMLLELQSELGVSLEAPAESIRLHLQQPPEKKDRPRAAYLIWNDPVMVAGGDTYISSCLSWLGYENLFQDRRRYPTVEIKDLEQADTIFLSSEPFVFRKRHVRMFSERLPDLDVQLIDGRLMSWYGASSLEFLRNPEKSLGGHQ